LFVALCVCVGKIISLPWFSKELKNDLSKNNSFCGVILILLIRESIFIGWGSSFSIVLVPRYKIFLCHTPIKPDLLGLFGNWCLCVWVARPRDHEVHIKSTRPTIKIIHESHLCENDKSTTLDILNNSSINTNKNVFT
jgi:hypothetical protein